MVKLSAVIITLNEEHNIRRCLESLGGVVDEIIVVDSFSTDKTEEICKEFNVKWIQNKFLGHIEQKNFALKSATYDHILSLDADEALDDELREQITAIKNNFEADGYYFNRLTHYVDQWIYRCGWYPDSKLRLLDRTKGQWSGTNPHDIISMNEGANIKKLQGNLLHYSYDSITDHVNQTNKFTTIAAMAAYKNGKRSNNFKIMTRPLLKFFKDYFLKRGFLDGKYGFVICCINSLSALLKYSKLKDLQDGKRIN
ncbi:glycosyltransferase family 2 protein [Halobacteriovorax sp. JY17]|uniref:glycosyltransferase family 2 protein n=1 Tax=Halobacteriovorax sp. JY17 TaxID=2014617 RepID=UPI000C36CC24|nr:glycosyltransferase family 2 protein [Halobacteriovorax sp. JY17]PIK14719.1 MAG: glycosyl transferase [Halobacteriovorax sp. JY17]